MDELIAFLHVRLDEDEQAARLASEVYGKSWWWNPSYGLVQGDQDDSEATSIFAVGEETVAEVWSEVGTHTARNDPDRILREIEAKREILALYEGAQLSAQVSEGTILAGGTRVRRGAHKAVVQVLALPYSDYQERWKP
ncbi:MULTISPECIES: DUF6221 family protein [Streptosporangium]|uniref:Uncharacterized protein n=1 Tax=Streptosporangium brasiliense TaxID=47480 RepID=A0ABT9RPE1_9ACTN|nr:DUF6221 family protein [Streptosporangium brasiliense]MDP9870220.1 hypothetical protein [Streptosporangium brasiliense]